LGATYFGIILEYLFCERISGPWKERVMNFKHVITDYILPIIGGLLALLVGFLASYHALLLLG
jgi:hypothetical protein